MLPTFVLGRFEMMGLVRPSVQRTLAVAGGVDLASSSGSVSEVFQAQPRTAEMLPNILRHPVTA